MKKIILFILIIITMPLIAFTDQKINVVATLSSYADIAKYIAKDKANISFIANGDEDPHFVKPKPSFALMLKNADLFISTGLDLELWEPALLDKAANRNIMSGAKGYVSASSGIQLLEIPKNPSRAAGDIHIFGNPHIYTSPINAKKIAENIATGLIKLDPNNEEFYLKNLENFKKEIDNHLFGETLVNLIGGERLCRLAESNKLIDFLKNNTYEGKFLYSYLGGWFKKAEKLNGLKIIGYHKDWIYFASLFGMQIIDYVEPKPGIPPTARHVAEVIQEIKEQNIKIIVMANYYPIQQAQAINERTSAKVVVVPLGVYGTKEADNYFHLIDLWIDKINEALEH